MATLEQLIIFFLLIGVGVIARKVGVITPGNTPQLTSLVFNFAMPAIILSGITTEQPHISGKDLSIVLTSAFTTLILLIICSRMLARMQEVMPIMGWVCRLCAPSLLCTGEMPLPVVKVASIHLASPLRCKRIKRRTIRLQTLSLELTKLSGRRQPDDMSV